MLVESESFDAKQAAQCTCTRAAGAAYPCPKCLASHDELHDICRDNFEPRTSDLMQDVLDYAREQSTKAALEDILQQHGMYNVEVRYCA